MLNFTVGPVMSSESIRKIGCEQVPYFRTNEFSDIMHENEELMLKFAKAPRNSRAVFMTGSGTLSMEAAVINCFTKDDKLLVIDGGSFGHRFVEILTIHSIPYSIIKPEFGHGITKEQLDKYDGEGFTGFLVNLDETSVGVLYDINLISDFCKRNNLFLVVDAISSFLCDRLDMDELNVQVMITGSQKALACPPGISIITLSPIAIERINSIKPRSLYLDLKRALKDGERGQTPFTCAVGILLQINKRLREIESNGGVDIEIDRVADLANYFRAGIKSFPFKVISTSLPNAVTPLSPLNDASAFDVFKILKNDYGIWVCPNGGELKNIVFRVGHIGDLSKKDYDTLFNAFLDMQDRKLI